jgi:hypothetical protein
MAHQAPIVFNSVDHFMFHFANIKRGHPLLYNPQRNAAPASSGVQAQANALAQSQAQAQAAAAAAFNQANALAQATTVQNVVHQHVSRDIDTTPAEEPSHPTYHRHEPHVVGVEVVPADTSDPSNVTAGAQLKLTFADNTTQIVTVKDPRLDVIESTLDRQTAILNSIHAAMHTQNSAMASIVQAQVGAANTILSQISDVNSRVEKIEKVV